MSIRNNKFLFTLLLLMMAAVIAACGGNGGGGDTGGGDTGGDTTENGGDTGGDSGGGDTTASGDPESGATVFENNCMSCHGQEGAGGSGPNLQESETASNHDEVVDIVTNGTDGGMPAFGDQLSDQEIQDVAAYVSQLGSN